MELRRTLRLSAVAAFVLVGGFIVATQLVPKSPAAAQQRQPQVTSELHAITFAASDLGEMVNGGPAFQGAELVIQGRVMTARVYEKPLTDAPVPPRRGISAAAGVPFTDFTVQVSEVVATSGAHPSQVTVVMMGGVTARESITVDEFPLLEVGQEYLLFLRQRPERLGGNYDIIGPQGYLKVQRGKAEPVVPGLLVVEALRGQDVGQVK